MRYYIIAGEASGDLHGSNLLKAIRKNDADATMQCWGGEMMESAGGHLVKHYRELAFMGFIEVLKNLPTILKNLRFCKEDIIHFRPDVLILIDYPGFNLRIAAWAKKQGIKVVYYISPQVWAWKADRVKKMKQCIDLMLVILPFEKTYFKEEWNWDVTYVGHPLIEVIENHPNIDENVFRNQLSLEPTEKVIALLPGSRKQEILAKLPFMLAVSNHFPEHRFVVAMAPGLEPSFYAPLLAPYKNVMAVQQKTYDLLLNAEAALVTSGTATLETALLGVPEIVCYKGSAISYSIAKRILKIKYISLVNLIMNRLIVKELIQHELTVYNIRKELSALLQDFHRKQQLQEDYADLKKLLQNGGKASENAAQCINNFLVQGKQ